MTARSSRVLVLLDERDESIVYAAARLAAHHGRALVGLAVEDRAVLSSAQLPFTREIGFASGIARPLVATELAGAMRERIERIQRRLDRVAREHGLQAAFRVGRGGRVEGVLEDVRPEDLLILRHRVHAWQVPIEGMLARATCSVMLVDAATREYGMTGGLMVLVDDSAGAGHALGQAIAQARAEGAPLSVVLPTDGQDGGAGAAVEVRLHEASVDAHRIELPQPSTDALLRTIRRERPRMLFLGRDCPLLSVSLASRRQLLREVPLVLVP